MALYSGRILGGECSDASECGFNHLNAAKEEDFDLNGVGSETLTSVLLNAVEVVPKDGEEIVIGLNAHGSRPALIPGPDRKGR